jgi:hypothetical protein
MVEPKKKTAPKEMITMLVRQLSAHEHGVRVAAWRAIERTMQSHGITWVDVGNWIEQGDKLEHDGGKYTEAEMQEFAQASRVEGVEAGIKIGMARASRSNGHIVLPGPSEMAEYCHARLGRLKDDKQREFVADMFVITRRRINLSLGRLGYLASIYIQIGGRI